MAGLARVIEEGIRFPGFAFINVQSPCVTYGQAEQQLKTQKQRLEPLETLGHDATDRLKAMALAQEYGTRLYTGVFYRDPNPDPTYETFVEERQQQMREAALPRERILDLFLPS
jgi:2-oxoglutarate ferredoxin oxidoreductase subunit beta